MELASRASSSDRDWTGAMHKLHSLNMEWSINQLLFGNVNHPKLTTSLQLCPDWLYCTRGFFVHFRGVDVHDIVASF